MRSYQSPTTTTVCGPSRSNEWRAGGGGREGEAGVGRDENEANPGPSLCIAAIAVPGDHSVPHTANQVPHHRIFSRFLPPEIREILQHTLELSPLGLGQRGSSPCELPPGRGDERYLPHYQPLSTIIVRCTSSPVTDVQHVGSE